MRRRSATLAALLSGGGGVALAGACILPDSGIGVQVGEPNEHPVRLVEHLRLSNEANCSCSEDESCDRECPLPQPTGLPHFLDPSIADYKFCACEPDEYDDNALPALEFFVEDEDVELKPAVPKDDIRAVLLLDLKADEPPTDYVAYHTYVVPENTLPLELTDYEENIQDHNRLPPQTRKLVVANNEETFDLCNDTNKETEMGPAFHTLTVLVTDREWFSTTRKDGTRISQPGVPDVKIGATWDRLDYTFYCSHRDEGDGEDPFDCATHCIGPQG